MTNPFFTSGRYQEIHLERIRFGAEQRIPETMLRAMKSELIQDQVTGDVLLQIQGTILGKKARSETFPDVVTSRVTGVEEFLAFASWWDHAKYAFRERFPKLGRRLTVRNIPIEVAHTHETLQRVTHTYHVCPHLEQDPERVHMRFMTQTTEADEAPTLATIEARLMDRYPAIGREYLAGLASEGLLNIAGDTPERRDFLRWFLSTKSHLAPGLKSLFELL